MLPTKFGVNLPFGSGEEAKKRFSIYIGENKPRPLEAMFLTNHGGHLGFPIGPGLAISDLQVTPILPTKFPVNRPRGVGGVVF